MLCRQNLRDPLHHGKVKQWERHAETSKEAHDKIKDLSKAAANWLKQEEPESLDPLRMTFEDLAKVFEKKKLVKAKYVNGRKVSGRRDLSAPKAWLASLREYFGKKKLAEFSSWHSSLSAIVPSSVSSCRAPFPHPSD
jgi:hypothetical protein